MYRKSNSNYNNNSGPDIKKREPIASFPKTERTELQVQRITTGDGQRFIDIRNWYTTAADPTTLKPSTTGVWIPEEMAFEVTQCLRKFFSKESEKPEQLTLDLTDVK